MTTTTGVAKPWNLPYDVCVTGETIGESLGYARFSGEDPPSTLILPPLPAAGGSYLGTGAVTYIKNSFNTLTLSVASGGTIDGSATLVVPEFRTAMLVTTGTEYTLWKMCVNGSEG